jgi:uncharacterized protein YndB with AHSA1/START domain
MWTHEHTVEADLPPEAIWQVLSNIDGWTSWDTSMEQTELLGPFAVGTEISMTPKGQDAVRSTIVAIEPDERYVDEVAFGDLRLRFTHALTRLDAGGTRLTFGLVISGPAADEAGPQLGAQITEDFPEAMAALVAAAASAERVR